MIDVHVVDLITGYLDQCLAESSEATLVGVYWHVDGQNKTLPLLDEINEALRQRPSVRVQRTTGGVTFGPSGTEHTVTVEDSRKADKQYRKEFNIALKR